MSENKQEKKDSWLKVLFRYTDGSERRMGLSVILSIISVIGGLVPYYCIYRGADLYIRNIGQVRCMRLSGGVSLHWSFML